MNNNNFHSLGISAPVCQALEALDYHQPTPIQSQAIPQLLAGKDLLGIAQTGTGKTAAFALPLLELLLADGIRARAKRPRVLILSPTRELAAQIFTEIEKYSRHVPIQSACIFGGVNARPQVRKLAAGIEILVATPGRLLDLANSGYLSLIDIDHLVLDEADRLLDMGFIRDVKKIIGMVPRSRQSLLFSATMPKEVADLAASILRNPVRIDVSPKSVTVKKVDQRFIEVENGSKQRMLEQLLLSDEVSRAIVFTRTKHGANKVAKKLVKSGIAAEAIHGNKSQNARQRALESFKSGKDWVLVATDIAARGIDVEGISHVINFELPHEPESYVHRIGRTARAGASGVAWSLVDPSEKKRLRAVERLTRMQAEIMEIDLPDAPNPPEKSEAPVHRNEPRSDARQGADQNGGNRRNRRGGQRRSRRRSARAA